MTTTEQGDVSPPNPDADEAQLGVIRLPDEGPGAGARRAARAEAQRRSKRRRRIIVAVIVVLVGLPTLYLGASIAGALRTPGNESFKAKWADWLRSHHGEKIVTIMEGWYFSQHQAKKGGKPAGLNRVPGATSQPTVVTGPPTTVPRHLPAPIDIPLLVQPGLPNEGHWQATGALVDGQPAMYVNQFRADTVYTSQITSAVWIDPKLARIRWVPGARDPGDWTITPCIGGPTAANVMAAFNGGFLFRDTQGGLYAEGKTQGDLRPGAASFVIYKDGHIAIGAWGTEVTMTPDVESVRQNLSLMMDNGQLAPNITHNDTSSWGATLKGSYAVARSGVGITANGALVYVAGPALTARTLAESLERAGAVRAMTLDINPEWVTFNIYKHPNPNDPSQIEGDAKLFSQQNRPASRYLCPTRESRDFFTISTS